MGRRTLLFSVLLLVLLVMASARLVLAPLLRPALGFAAKVACSEVYIGGSSLAQARSAFPDERLRAVVRVHADRAARRIEARIPLLGRREARFRGGAGCTLVPADGSASLVPAARLQASPRASPPTAAATGAPWPEGEASARPAADVDTAALTHALEGAFTEQAGAAARRTRAVVVVHRGRIIAERYAPGVPADRRFPGWSMAKSVTSALAGILVGDGRVSLADANLRVEWRDDRSRITLRDLLHMSSGLDFDESYTPTGGATRMLFDAADAAAAAAAAELVHEPGIRWYYASATTNLLSGYLRSRFAPDDAAYHALPHERLFAPLGMRSAVLEVDAAGTFVGSSFMYASARDWARFGLLYLQDGVWQGERILPPGWVAFSRTPAPAAPLGRYGAHWWLNAGEGSDGTRRVYPQLPRDLFWAAGYQGQFVAVVPSRELVVVRLGLTEREGAFDLGSFLAEVLAALTPTTGARVPPLSRR